MSQRNFFNSRITLTAELNIKCIIYTQEHGELTYELKAHNLASLEKAIDEIAKKKAVLVCKNMIPIRGCSISLTGTAGKSAIEKRFSNTEDAIKFAKTIPFYEAVYVNYALENRMI